MKKYILLLIIVFLSFNHSFSQITRFRSTINADTSETDLGKNKKNYVSFTMQYGMYFLADKTFKDFGSSNYAFSVFYQHKLADWYSYGFDFSFNFTGFQMTKKQEDKTFPDTIINNKESVSLTSFGVELYQRFNFFNKHRGEILGKYLDMGVYGNIHMSSTYYFRNIHDRHAANFFTKKNDVYFRSPDFLNKYDYGVTARIGINWFSVFARYRLSNLMKPAYQEYRLPDDYGYPELPNLQAGIKVFF